ncbi:MAG: serine/threonine-protein kinase [Myxococcota bacterium]
MSAGLSGTRVGDRYTVGDEIGRGGFSIVYGGTDEQTHEPIALKLLVPPPASAEIALERLRREVRAAQRLSHPNVARVHGLIEESDRAFIVMERVMGKTLRALVESEGPQPAARVKQIAIDVAQALEHAHQALILHRDVKPENIVVPGEGPAKLVDFGSARIEGDTTLTRTGGFVGTLDYAAPEVIDGARPDARADVYGLGLSMFYALTGQLPRRPSAQLPPQPVPYGHRPSTLMPAVSPSLDAIVRRATMADPRHRFPTIATMRAALELNAVASSGLMRPTFCPACGDSLSGAARACRRCESAPPAPTDHLLYVDRQASGSSAAAAERLMKLLGPEISPSAAREVAVGLRPLVTVRARDLPTVVERFHKEGVRLRAGRPLAARFPPLVGGSLIAAFVTMGVFLLSGHLGMVLVGLGLIGGTMALLYRIARSPLIARRPPPATEAIPAEIWARFAIAESELQDPAMRGVLVDIAELSHQAIGQKDLDSREIFPLVRRLFEAAIAGAEALSRVDRALSRAARGGPGGRAEEARAALVQRLLEGLGTMTNLVVGAPGSELARQLEAACAELSKEIALRDEAMAEVEALTSGVAGTSGPR